MLKINKNIVSILTISLILSTNVAFGQANRENQYDYVGRLHNEILKEAYKVSSKSSSYDEVCKVVNSICDKNAEFKRVTSGSNYRTDAKFVETALSDYSQQFKNVISNSKLSDNAKTYAQNLINYMFDMAKSKEEPKYEDVYNKICGFEKDILQDVKLNETDKVTLLGGTSVARYSTYLWNVENPLEPTNPLEPAKIKGFWRWIATAVGDAVGAISGGSAGGVAGAIGGAINLSKATYDWAGNW
ncbi:MAG: hypothetical protein FWD66_05045 [Paludibacter sp.]|nr:hypothetical protein [Paludibacter sp.]